MIIKPIIGIYKITNPTGKIYIGQSINIEVRLKSYKKKLPKNQPRLFNSFKKYGFENHIFEIIEVCELHDLNRFERYYQDLFNASNKNGLNCRLTGYDDISGSLSDETKKKMAKNKNLDYLIGNSFRKGIKHTDEIKKKISNSLKGRFSGDKNPMFGRVFTADERIKFGRKGILNKKFGIKKTQEEKIRDREISPCSFIILDTISGVFFDSIKHASEVYEINYCTLKCYLNGRLRNRTNLIIA